MQDYEWVCMTIYDYVLLCMTLKLSLAKIPKEGVGGFKKNQKFNTFYLRILKTQGKNNFFQKCLDSKWLPFQND